MYISPFIYSPMHCNVFFSFTDQFVNLSTNENCNNRELLQFDYINNEQVLFGSWLTYIVQNTLNIGNLL